MGGNESGLVSALLHALWQSVMIFVVVPLVFYLEWDGVGPLGWGLSTALSVFCVLVAVGGHYGGKAEYHTQMEAKGDWIDKIGAGWLFFCFFSPLINLGIDKFVPLTAGNWTLVYGVEFFLAGMLPVISSFALTRYVWSNRHPLVPLMILIVVTSFPVLTVGGVGMDLLGGAMNSGGATLILEHTGAMLPL